MGIASPSRYAQPEVSGTESVQTLPLQVAQPLMSVMALGSTWATVWPMV
jgi:hypothetical protein